MCKGYGIVHRDIFDDDRISANGKYLYIVLSAMCNTKDEDPHCWYSINSLSDMMSQSRSTIIRATKELESTGWLRVERSRESADKNNNNIYYPTIIKGSVTQTPPSIRETPPSIRETPPSIRETPPSITQTLGVVSERHPNINNKILTKNNNNNSNKEYTAATFLISELSKIAGIEYVLTEKLESNLNKIQESGNTFEYIADVLSYTANRFVFLDKRYMLDSNILFDSKRFEEFKNEYENQQKKEEVKHISIPKVEWG